MSKNNTVFKFPEPTFKDKDGDGGDSSLCDTVTIKAVYNGYIVTSMFEDGSEVVEVYAQNDINGLLDSIKESLGI